jgi:hypothetical protein
MNDSGRSGAWMSSAMSAIVQTARREFFPKLELGAVPQKTSQITENCRLRSTAAAWRLSLNLSPTKVVGCALGRYCLIRLLRAAAFVASSLYKQNYDSMHNA